jgi:hypothetical protein
VDGRPTVEILFFAGCPNTQLARELVEQVAAEADVETDVRLTEVRSRAEAERLRFLGSPTVRVNGCDVEPGADERDAFVLSCRVYQTPEGLRGQPAAEWVRAALTNVAAS